MGFWGDLVAAIKELLVVVWEFLKKLFLRLLNFIIHIANFFKNDERLRKLAADKNRIAVAIKENLENGNYQVVNCLYDKEKAELVTPEQDAEVMTAEQLDSETIRHFADKDMIVCK